MKFLLVFFLSLSVYSSCHQLGYFLNPALGFGQGAVYSLDTYSKQKSLKESEDNEEYFDYHQIQRVPGLPGMYIVSKIFENHSPFTYKGSDYVYLKVKMRESGKIIEKEFVKAKRYFHLYLAFHDYGNDECGISLQPINSFGLRKPYPFLSSESLINKNNSFIGSIYTFEKDEYHYFSLESVGIVSESKEWEEEAK